MRKFAPLLILALFCSLASAQQATVSVGSVTKYSGIATNERDIKLTFRSLQGKVFGALSDILQSYRLGEIESRLRICFWMGVSGIGKV